LGAASDQEQVIGLCRSGNTITTHLAKISYGLRIELILTGDVCGSKVANKFVKLLPKTDFY
jgi:hypothetical protein